jgi:hypothetical protein
VAQQHAAALVVVPHWNQTGTGKGSERMSGAGPAEWGRVLVSVNVEHRSTDSATKATHVTLGWSFEGDEIPDIRLRTRRRVWAEDPDDLGSALHYEVEVLDADGAPVVGVAGLSPAVARVLAVLEDAGRAVTVREIGDALAEDSTGRRPLKARTIQDALNKLRESGLAENYQGEGAAYLWRAQSVPEGGEECS